MIFNRLLIRLQISNSIQSRLQNTRNTGIERAQMTDEIVNDISIQIATVNGSGSQAANAVLTRTIFKMGVPVSGKNLFPSNIAGLPTWYTIRANAQGYLARKAELDFLISLNPQTAGEDVMALRPGGVLLAEEAFGLKNLRNDIYCYEVPFSRIAADISEDTRLRKMLANMVYVGAAAHLLLLDSAEVQKAVCRQFEKKPGAAELNIKAVQAGFEYSASNIAKSDPFRIMPMDKTHGKMMVDGNSAAAIGAMFGGCTIVTWYPITPSTSLIEQLSAFMKKYRRDPRTGKSTYAIVQAEDEIAALGMVVGAGWAGARAMTSTSGPGISLMSEFAGFAYFAEIPVVIWDIQRVGPSTGLPTRTSQADIMSCYFLGHGDIRHIMLIPATVEECFLFAQQAFNLAEKYQTAVFCMSDLDLGMNNWISDEFQYPDAIPIDRGKILSESDLKRIGKFSRYLDVDGDAIPFRTIPGNGHPLAAYFTRGSGHNSSAEYSERPDDYVRLLDRLGSKIRNAAASTPMPLLDSRKSEIGIIAYGSTHHAVQECRDQLESEFGMRTDYLRIRSLPPHPDIQSFLENHRRIYLVEQNRDAQMRGILSIEFPQASNLFSVLHYSGVPIDARFITESIAKQERIK
jgi:2-oxoglutarate/2-oxoacid ferredoxin oxidoreductase subunit alpha